MYIHEFNMELPSPVTPSAFNIDIQVLARFGQLGQPRLRTLHGARVQVKRRRPVPKERRFVEENIRHLLNPRVIKVDDPSTTSLLNFKKTDSIAAMLHLALLLKQLLHERK